MAHRRQLKNSEFHLKSAEVDQVIHAAESFRDRCIVKTFARTGMRRCELAALDIRDVDFEKKLIHIREGKGSKERIVPMTPDLAADLRQLLKIERRRTGPLFLSNYKRHLSLRSINRIVSDAGQLAGVKHPNPASNGNVTPHLLRHSFARFWKQRRGSLESLAKILGHSSTATTMDMYGTESLEDVKLNYETLMSEVG